MSDGNSSVSAQLLTVQEIATAMRVSEMTVYRLIRDGRLGAVRIGKHLRVPREEFQSFLNSNVVNVSVSANGAGA